MDWAGLFTYTGVTAITPGPNNIMSMSGASRLGFRKSYAFNLGVAAGFFALALMAAIFCSTMSMLIPAIKTPMLVVGAAYLLYLAWKTYSSADVQESEKIHHGFLQGFILQFVNPKAYLNNIISFQAYILPNFDGNWLAIVGFALVLASICLVSTSLWSLFGSGFKVLFSKYGRVTNTVMALALVYCAIALFL